MLTYYHPLDVVPGGVEPLIHVSQGDTNTRIAFELFARTGNFFLQGGTEVNIRGRRSDGEKVTASAFISNNRIYVTLTAEMTATPGRGKYEVSLEKSGKTMGTANFILMVEKRP
jgi:hypothetical protein